VEFHKPLWRNAPHWVPGDHSAASQVLAAVRHAADIQTFRIERIGVNVKTTSGLVGQDEVAFPAIVAMLLAKAARAEQGAKARYLHVRYRDIEVIVRSRLLSEYGINRPSSIDVNLQAILFQKRNEVGGILLEHNCSVAAVLKVGFLGLVLPSAPPDHSTISRTRRLIDLETHEAVFTWMLQRLADAGLVKGKTVGIDATTLEANAALRSIRSYISEPDRGRRNRRRARLRGPPSTAIVAVSAFPRPARAAAARRALGTTLCPSL